MITWWFGLVDLNEPFTEMHWDAHPIAGFSMVFSPHLCWFVAPSHNSWINIDRSMNLGSFRKIWNSCGFAQNRPSEKPRDFFERSTSLNQASELTPLKRGDILLTGAGAVRAMRAMEWIQMELIGISLRRFWDLPGKHLNMENTLGSLRNDLHMVTFPFGGLEDMHCLIMLWYIEMS